MPSKKHKPEEIIGKLRDFEIMLGCRRPAPTDDNGGRGNDALTIKSYHR